MEPMTEEKYITFKREEFEGWLNHLSMLLDEARELSLKDAVVIRRQDLFASPCLATYSSMISMVANNISNPTQAKELMAIADYFEDQARLAAAEGYKLPDR
jgi:hypothetical protein